MSATSTGVSYFNLLLQATQDEDPISHVVQGVIDQLVSGVESLLDSDSGSDTCPSNDVNSHLVDSHLVNDNEEAVTENKNERFSCFEFQEEVEGDRQHDPNIKLKTQGSLFLRKRPTKCMPKKNPVCIEVQKSSFSPVCKRPRLQNMQEEHSTSTSVGYVFSNQILEQADRIPKVKGRARHVHELIKSYRLTCLLKVIPSKPATEDDLRSFHSLEYIEYIKTLESRDMNRTLDEDGQFETSMVGEDFGFGYDCPTIPSMMSLLKEIAGSTLTAVKTVLEGTVKTAINFHGGWHHSKPDEASGFCYVNDIVIGILYALKQPGVDRVLYLDFDLHHGDAVQDAFYHSSRVMTVSLHKYEIAFFPGTGALEDIGIGKGKGYSVNVPLKDGITDDNYRFVSKHVLNQVFSCFKPDLIVAQFGADCIANDPLKSFNLTPDTLVSCLRQIKSWEKPLVILGGGGYNFINTSKTWTRLTAASVGVQLSNDIPEDEHFFLEYGPSFELIVDPCFPRDCNDHSYLTRVIRTVQGNLNKFVSNS